MLSVANMSPSPRKRMSPLQRTRRIHSGSAPGTPHSCDLRLLDDFLRHLRHELLGHLLADLFLHDLRHVGHANRALFRFFLRFDGGGICPRPCSARPSTIACACSRVSDAAFDQASAAG